MRAGQSKPVVRYAVRASGGIPETVRQAAERSVREERAERGTGQEGVGGIVPGAIGAVTAGVTGSVTAGQAVQAGIGGMVNVAPKDHVAPEDEGQAHTEYQPSGRFSAQDQARYGARAIRDSRIGHLRHGPCRADGRNLCASFSPVAIRIGRDYLSTRYAGRLAATLADKFRDARGRLTDIGARTLAAAYVNTLESVQEMPEDWKRLARQLGYWRPDEGVLPPHLAPSHTGDLSEETARFSWHPQDERGSWQGNTWVFNHRLILNQTMEFISRLLKELDAARPLPRDVRLAVARMQYVPKGTFTLRATEADAPRIEIRRTRADDFLAPA